MYSWSGGISGVGENILIKPLAVSQILLAAPTGLAHMFLNDLDPLLLTWFNFNPSMDK